MNQRCALLHVEELETRTVPAVLLNPSLGSAPVLHLSQLSATQNNQHIFGTVQGHYAILDPMGVDAGSGAGFWGNGKLDLLGSVHLTGSLHGTGDIARGHANGELTLTNGRGSVTLELVGPEQGMFAPLPHSFHFSVVKATGALQGLQMTGSVDLVQHSNGTFKMTFELVKFHDAKALAGNGQGGFSVGRYFPDVGTTYHLGGSAHLGLLGGVTISGSIQTTGMIPSGRAVGELTLTNAQGSVLLQVTGPTQRGFAPLPETFQFKVMGATGAYIGLYATGSLDIKLDPIVWMHPQAGPGNPLPGPWEGGSFHITIQPHAG